MAAWQCAQCGAVVVIEHCRCLPSLLNVALLTYRTWQHPAQLRRHATAHRAYTSTICLPFALLSACKDKHHLSLRIACLTVDEGGIHRLIRPQLHGCHQPRKLHHIIAAGRQPTIYTTAVIRTAACTACDLYCRRRWWPYMFPHQCLKVCNVCRVFYIV